MPLYTRTGDDGTTGLIGGSRARKDDLRIAAYGSVDELNAHLGVARTVAERWLDALLAPVQNELFVVGSHLALGPGESAERFAVPPLRIESTLRLEAEIDAADAELAPLRNFILPGGAPAAAALHVARTVCRRAERDVVRIAGDAQAEGHTVRYLNRLSDWLFAQARLTNHRAGIADVPWTHAGS